MPNPSKNFNRYDIKDILFSLILIFSIKLAHSYYKKYINKESDLFFYDLKKIKQCYVANTKIFLWWTLPVLILLIIIDKINLSVNNILAFLSFFFLIISTLTQFRFHKYYPSSSDNLKDINYDIMSLLYMISSALLIFSVFLRC